MIQRERIDHRKRSPHPERNVRDPIAVDEESRSFHHRLLAATQVLIYRATR